MKVSFPKAKYEGSGNFWDEAHGYKPTQLAALLFASHPERLIGLGRLVFSAFAFLAVYLDPTHPARDVGETYVILALYVGFSASIAAISLYRTLKSWAQFIIHATDIITLSILVHFTDGLTSPFFAFVTFAVLTATMRWSWRGALATAFILQTLLLAASWPDIELSFDKYSDLNLVIMRSAYLLVAAAMLGYLGAYRERSRDRLSKLAAWPLANTTQDPQDENPPLVDSLRHAAEVLGAFRLLVFWQDRDRSAGRMALWNGQVCEFASMPNMETWKFVAAGPPQATVHVVDTDRDMRLRNQPLPDGTPPFLFASDAENTGRFRTFCTAPFRSSRYLGRVFVLDPRDHSEDILSLTQIVAARIVSELERFALAKELAAAAIAEERIRMARDMHDSVLQDLTAANLLLKNVTNGMTRSSAASLGEVSQLLLSQQKRIRAFVENARSSEILTRKPLGERLAGFVDTLGQQWRCTLAVNIEPPSLEADGKVSADICQIVSEATANAVRHGGADRLEFDVRRKGRMLRIAICDNGRGVPDKTASRPELQPHSIRERVMALGGKFSVGKSDRGLSLEIEIPA